MILNSRLGIGYPTLLVRNIETNQHQFVDDNFGITNAIDTRRVQWQKSDALQKYAIDAQNTGTNQNRLALNKPDLVVSRHGEAQEKASETPTLAEVLHVLLSGSDED